VISQAKTMLASTNHSPKGRMPSPGTKGRPLRVLIADRDELCRERVKTLLATEANVEIVGECTKAVEIIPSLRAHEPDLLLLEPRMPGGNAFDFLALLPTESLPLLIFVTSQDQYALKAFETKAFDFVLKPLDQNRFNAAIERARLDVSRMRADTLTQRQMALIRQVRSIPEGRLIVKWAGRIVFLEVSEIDWIKADANYVIIHAGMQAYRMREPIGQLAKRLAEYNFSRIHRSVIVNASRIKEVEPCNSGEYMVRLESGKELPCSRNYNSAIRALLRSIKYQMSVARP
jgi:two-component system LytT family response regulator